MILLPSLAKKIIREVEKVVDEHIIIVNVDGIIIASTDKKRVGTFHEGALKSIHDKQQLIITKADEKRYQGVKAGLNLPVFFSNDVIGVIGITGEPEQVLPYGELLRKMMELLIKESYYSEQLQLQSRMLEAFVFDWIQLKEWAPSFMERAKLLNIDLKGKRQIILIYSKDQTEFLNQDLWQLKQTWNDQYVDDIFIRWGNDRLVIIHTVENEQRGKDLLLQKTKEIKSFIEKTWNSTTAIGIGQVVASNKLKRTYEQAEQALSVALKDNTIVFEENLRLDICLSEISQPTRIEFTRRVLQSVMDDEVLLETFYIFFQENMSLKHTAQYLHIHINTLHYRIKKLENLTGLNLKFFPDVVSLYLALYFLDYHPKNKADN